MKKIFAGLLCGVIIAASVTVALASSEILQASKVKVPIIVNGVEHKTESSAVSIDDEIYLPFSTLALIGEKMGVGFEWDNEAETLSVGNMDYQVTADGFVFSNNVGMRHSTANTYIFGEVANNSGKDYTRLNISVTIYDKEGSLVNRDTGSVSDIKNGQTKTFQIIFYDQLIDKDVQFKFQVDSKH